MPRSTRRASVLEHVDDSDANAGSVELVVGELLDVNVVDEK